MPDLFVPLDVNYQESDKILGVTPLAELTYIRCLCLAKRRMSDGLVTFRQMDRLTEDFDRYGDDEQYAKQLVTAGLLTEVEDGWVISSWEKHNKKRSEVKSQGTKLNHQRWHVNRGLVDNECVWCAESDPESAADSVTDSTSSHRRALGSESVVLPGSGRIQRVTGAPT